MVSKKGSIFAPRTRILKKAKLLADKIDSLKDRFAKLSDDELSGMTEVFLQRLKKGETLDDILPEAFATARETIYRVTGMFAFKVQLIGAIVVHWGDFAEMYTGEGKTLTIVIVAYLNALSKKGVHVVTVNEYLVQRDAKFCAECLNPLGITVGYNLSSFDQKQKKEMYGYDITYTTNSELGFDYLRDNMVRNYEEKVIRELNFAIVDEADSVLIDEARTPLIISGQPKQDISSYVAVDTFVKTLGKNDYKIDPESNAISLTDEGVIKTQNYFKIKNIFSFTNSELLHKIKNSLTANFVFKEGVEYVVKNNEILLVDQFTGRILHGRSYNAGLQQAIQAKEMVKIEPENVTVATITYQSFFRMYSKLSGVSGTALTEEEEFIKIYNMVVVPIPTNKPNIRKDMNDYVFANKISKWVHVVDEIERVHKTGQPILVGTASVEDSEQLCTMLKNKGINFELLNAKNDMREAEIVKNAGQKGAITISTNMAGRGTDIKLGPGVKELGGLYVIGTERNESRRIDNQLRGRSGRQGDPGITRFFISLEDTLFRRFATDKFDKAESKIIDNDYFDSYFFTKLLNSTQKKIEGMNFDTRKNLIDYDSVLSNQRELVYAQRNYILKHDDISESLVKLCQPVAKDIVNLFKLPNNELYVDGPRLTAVVNNNFFKEIILTNDWFVNKTTDDAIKILTDILTVSITSRIEILQKQGSLKILKDIFIQSLDVQWTAHLDKISKIREGAWLRSLEQRSPLNIYVEEADWNFNEMRKNIAHQVILSLHKIFLPRSNDNLRLALRNILNKHDLTLSAITQKAVDSNVDNINTITNEKPNLKVNLKPHSPNDAPKKEILSAKEKLLRQVAAKKKEKQSTQAKTIKNQKKVKNVTKKINK